MTCQNGVWLRARDDKNNTVIFINPPCGLKSCPHCSKTLRNKHFARVLIAMQLYPDYTWMFVTTTGRKWWRKVNDKKGITRGLIAHVWSKFRKRMARASPDGILWMRVYEQHKSGVWHTHAIIGCKSEWWNESGIGEHVTIAKKAKRKQKSWKIVTTKRYKTDRRTRAIRRHWFACGGGEQINMQLLTNDISGEEKIRYVVKYATKPTNNDDGEDVTVGIRTTDYSRNFPKFPKPTPEMILEWEFIGSNLSDHELNWWIEQGFKIKSPKRA